MIRVYLDSSCAGEDEDVATVTKEEKGVDKRIGQGIRRPGVLHTLKVIVEYWSEKIKPLGFECHFAGRDAFSADHGIGDELS